LASLALCFQPYLAGFAPGFLVACPPGVGLQRDSLIVDTHDRGDFASVIERAAQVITTSEKSVWFCCHSVGGCLMFHDNPPHGRRLLKRRQVVIVNNEQPLR
jgi:hypothetical protein